MSHYKNLGVSGAISPSGKSLTALKREIGRIAGAQDDPDEVGAQVAIEHALTRIFETPWDYYLVLEQVTTVAGTSTYALPAGVRSIQMVRCSSNSERMLVPIRYDEYSKRVPSQTGNSYSTHYTLQMLGSDNFIWFLPVPDSAETIDVWYFREPAWPSNGNDIVDIPRFLEMPLILLAQGYVAKNTESVPARKCELVLALGEDALKGARSRDRNWFDEDVGFRKEALSQNWPWDHPNRGDDY